MRTNAAGMPEEVLRADLQQLMADWQIIQARAKLARSPQVLHRELDISVRIVRDYLNACIDEVVVDSRLFTGVCRNFCRILPKAEVANCCCMTSRQIFFHTTV